MPGPARLYDVDFYHWTREQAALLQRIPDERLNISREGLKNSIAPCLKRFELREINELP